MANDLPLGLTPPPAGEPVRKRGRPKGSTNKRTGDFKGYIEALYGGTAAQQSAAFCMVTPRELRAAKGNMAQARVDKALDLVRRIKAADGAAQLGLVEAMRMIAGELDSLKPYTDQRQAQLATLDPNTGKPILPLIIGLPMAPMYLDPADGAIDGEYEQLQRLNDLRPVEVSPLKSHEEG